MLMEIFWILLMLGMIGATIVVALRERKTRTAAAKTSKPKDEAMAEQGIDAGALDELPEGDLDQFALDEKASP